MPSDRSRRTDPQIFGYTGVVAQQGRVILDRDFNAGQGFAADRVAGDALDFVGPCGTPDGGFAISLPGPAPQSPPYWSPPVAAPAESPPVAPGSSSDFLIAPGTMYIGGERVVFRPEQNGAPVTYSYFDQPDWYGPPAPAPDLQRELVYLDVAEQEVSATEDPDLLEVALGGPDTTQRLKLLRRVARTQVPSATCSDAWATVVSQWQESGWLFDPTSMRLTPAARLQVGFTQTAGANTPCDPIASGGYLGADNQLIRVRIAGSIASPTLLWGYDDASFIYAITAVDPTGTILTLATDPPDALHWPQTGQVVEILQTAAVLGTEPDETPGGPQPLLRVAAETDGVLNTLAQSYGPVGGSTGNVVVLAHALPASVAASAMPRFLRVWQAEIAFSPGVATALNDPVTRTSTGVTVTMSAVSATALATGAFWLIAVRPATPQGVYPESLLTAPQPPDGPRRWACPLAVIDWTAQTVTDCRQSFDNLVTLTRRRPGCCTVSIGLQDVTKTRILQTLIDQAAKQAQSVTVCLDAGSYALPGPLRLDSRHNGMTIESCGGGAQLAADATADTSLFADGLLVLTGASSVTLKGLSLSVPYVPAKAAPGTVSTVQTGYGIRAFSASGLTLQDCAMTFPNLPYAADRLFVELVTRYLFAAAVLLQGDCHGLTVRGCQFGAAVTPTYTAIDVQSQSRSSPVEVANRFAVRQGLKPFADDAKANLQALAPDPHPERTEAVERFAATLQRTSPPLAPATRFADRAAASRDILDAVSGPAPPESRVVDVAPSKPFLPGDPINVGKPIILDRPAPPVVATAGIVAANTPNEVEKSFATETPVACLLGDSTIRESTFANLTFATFITASATTLRLQDNTVTGCVGGFWYGVPDPVLPDAPATDTAYYYFAVTLFQEYYLANLCLAALPLPHVPAGSTLPGDAGANTDVAEAVWLVTGNRVDPGSGGNAAAGATCALVLSLSSAENERGDANSAQSVIVSANHLRITTQKLAAPTALLALPRHTPCSITGNVILNWLTGTSGDQTVKGFSLWLVVADTAMDQTGPDQTGEPQGTQLLSVTGNTFYWLSNLLALVREGSKPPAGWYPFNADPS